MDLRGEVTISKDFSLKIISLYYKTIALNTFYAKSIIMKIEKRRLQSKIK